jgi:hypothetical protein
MVRIRIRIISRHTAAVHEHDYPVHGLVPDGDFRVPGLAIEVHDGSTQVVIIWGFTNLNGHPIVPEV